MMRKAVCVSALLAGVAMWAVAGDGHSGKKSCGMSAGGCAKLQGVAQAKAGACEPGACKKDDLIPAMYYQVGQEKFCCAKGAEQAAEKNSEPIRYVVDGKTYDDPNAALSAYAELLEKRLEELTTVRYAVGEETLTCPVSAADLARSRNAKVEYRLGRFTFGDEATARKAAEAAREAAARVEMKVVVDGKEVAGGPSHETAKAGCHSRGVSAKADSPVQCPHGAARAVAAEDGPPRCGNTETRTVASGSTEQHKTEFVIGQTRTCCEKTAEVELTKARIQAAADAIGKLVKA